MTRKSLTLAAAGLLCLPALSGCWAGMNASTTIQEDSGNGITADVDDIEVRALTLVAGNSDTTAASVSTTVVNSGEEKIEIESAEASGRPGSIEGEAQIDPDEALIVGTDADVQITFTGVSARPGEYVDFEMEFSNGATVSESVLLVPPVGYYEEVAPPGTTPEPREETEEVEVEVEETEE